MYSLSASLIVSQSVVLLSGSFCSIMLFASPISVAAFSSNFTLFTFDMVFKY